MPVWTIPGTPFREQLRDHARESAPRYLYPRTRQEEIEETAAELQSMARAYGDDWVRNTYILLADRRYLLAHAHDRSVAAQEGESDPAFRGRIRNPADLVTQPALMPIIQQLVDDAGIVGTVEGYNLRPNRCFDGVHATETKTDGGEFAEQAGDEMIYTPTTRFGTIPIFGRDKLDVSGSASNDGTYVITGLVGNGFVYTDATGVNEVLGSGPSVSVQHFDPDGVLQDGFAREYLSRGYRMGSRVTPNSLVVILPYGCDESLRQTVVRLLERDAAFGVGLVVECRVNP
jgi:hypothetical protein